jgi:indole-3-glycerol phosphate synthase
MAMLDEILAHKRSEIEVLRRQYADWSPPAALPARRGFKKALGGTGVSLIAEFKRRSPSRGAIRADAQPAEMATTYQRAGAAALSVLTDKRYFGGSTEDLITAREATNLPTLRKDFLIERGQIAESSGLEGPDCVLLISAVLRAEDLRELRELAAACGQDALVEVHNEGELERALKSGAEIIGINNRDLKTFQVSLETTLRLRPLVPAGIPVVAESGIRTRDDVKRMEEVGVDGILVGEALMAAPDPGVKIRELLGTT